MYYTLPEKIKTNIDYFTGRTWLLPELLQWYEKTYDRMLLITGDPGTGKSMVAAWLAGSGPLPDDPIHRDNLVFLRSQRKAAHFCQVDSGSDQPENLAKNLADQFVAALPGFDQEIKKILAERIVLSPQIDVEKVESGGQITGVLVEDFNLKGMDDETRFNRSVRQPLINLYRQGYDEQILIIIDSLDEALGYSGEVKIPDLLAKLADLPYQIRFLATTRPDPNVLKRFFGVKIIDLRDDAPINDTDIYNYALNQLPESLIDPQRSKLSQEVSEASEGIFLYAQLAVNDLGKQLESGPLPKRIKFPDGLGGFYNRFLQRELGKNQSIWINQFSPVLGVISVAQGDGLYRKHIERFTAQKVDEILFSCQQYLDGAYPDGPFRVFHRSFAEFLLEGKSQYFRIDASDMHGRIADYYYNLKDGSPPLSKWDEYALHFINIHLEGASRIDNEQQRHLHAERLVTLVLDPRFKKRFYKRINDESLMLSNILLAVRAAAHDTDESAMELLLLALRRLQAHRHEHLQPGPVFERAEKGDIDGALNRLALLPVEPQWQRAASLVVAWLGAKTNPKKAEEVLLRMESQLLRSTPEKVLYKRLRAVIVDEKPLLEPLPPEPDPQVLNLMLMRLGGQNTGEGISGEIISGHDLHPNPHFVEVLGDLNPGTGDNVPVFLAQQDGPFLVSFAVKHPEEGLQKIKSYIDLHAANPYLYYRNASLWLLLDFLLRHPDDEWTLKSLETLFVTALNMEGVAYEEALINVLLALQSNAGKIESFQALEDRRKFAQEQVNNLQHNSRYQGDTWGVHYQGDTWGVHKRRMCALAQAYHFMPKREETVEKLIDSAVDLPIGFAGFMFKAWLNLAETVRICEQESRHSIENILEEALKAAQNIQDSVFCARSTAIVNAMIERWWPLPDESELEKLLEQFNRQPDAPQFTALHFVGEDYPHREDDPDKLPLQDVLLKANSLFEISDAFRLPIADLVAANIENGWDANTSLPIGTPVHIPVPFFTPLISTRLSVEITVADWLEPNEKRPLIQELTLAAINDRQAIDTLLSRVMLAASPNDLPMLERMMEPAQQVYDQFPDSYTLGEVA